MDIIDKIPSSGEHCCPPHRLPHVLPIIGQPVMDEPCHYHQAWWRQAHHSFFCYLLKCPYRDLMLAERAKKMDSENYHKPDSYIADNRSLSDKT